MMRPVLRPATLNSTPAIRPSDGLKWYSTAGAR
jgi:hypothetical protein